MQTFPVFKKVMKRRLSTTDPFLVSKIAKRCVFAHFYSLIAGNIYPLQHGFAKGRSTITQLLDTVHQITSTIDQGVQTEIAF